MTIRLADDGERLHRVLEEVDLNPLPFEHFVITEEKLVGLVEPNCALIV